MGGEAQVLTPGTALKLGQFAGGQHFVLAQFRQQANHRRPITALLMQALQLTQHLRVMGMTFVHCLQGDQCTVAVATVQLQLRMAQGNRQLGLGLTLQGALQQAVGLFIPPLLIRGTGRAEVVQQWLTLGFGGSVQVALGAGPAALGEVHLALLDSDLNTAAAIAP